VVGVQGNGRLKTLIVDSSPAVREHLIELVAHVDTIEVVGQAGSKAEAVEAIARLGPDVIVLDPVTQGGGVQDLQEIRQAAPDAKIVTLVFYPHSRFPATFLGAGANYVLDKLTEVRRVGEVLAAL
jgi:DNA-binding NarL/FixJ family response regulator